MISVEGLVARFMEGRDRRRRRSDIKAYMQGGRRPWSAGYHECKFDFIRTVLADSSRMELFRTMKPLPGNFGYGFDERVVEYPWTISRLSEGAGKLLDAGSVFNYREIVEHPKISKKHFTVMTLAPETHAFWQKGISYHYGDLRELPFRDEWFDEVISLSTLGHIGMDNRMYTRETSHGEIGLEAGKAVGELIRVLRPGGRFLASVVFGRHQLIDWKDGSPFAEQFDSALLESLLAAFSGCGRVAAYFYKYDEKGWNVCREEDCRDLEYFNVHTAKSFAPDNAAAARAVALIDVVK